MRINRKKAKLFANKLANWHSKLLTAQQGIVLKLKLMDIFLFIYLLCTALIMRRIH